MKKSLRILIILAGALLVPAILASGAWLFFSRSPLPKTRGRIKAAGLIAEVEVLRDRDGVPHLFAKNMHDLYFAQGYVHAQDRFWQMEFWRRTGSGRLSEFFGETVLGTDIYLRTVGFKRIAEQEYASYDKETRAILEAYAEGVNAYIGKRKPYRLGLEFTLLKLQGVDFEIEPWTPVNTLTWLKIMSQDLGGNLDKELYSVDILRLAGLGLLKSFFSTYREADMPLIVNEQELTNKAIAKSGIRAAELDENRLALLSRIETKLIGGFDPSQSLAFGKGGGVGSNSWVVSGRLTASGRPILANDTHLGIQMPSIWYEIGLHCDPDPEAKGRGEKRLHVRGFSFAGTPTVIIGHNERIAWGLTNLGPDVQDLYIERINPENPDQYEVNGVWTDMEIVREEIRIHKEEEPFVLLVRNTRHGPIMTDHGTWMANTGFGILPEKIFPDNLELTALSLRWTALQPNRTTKAFILLNQAQSFEEFRAALRYFDVPSQSIVYADVDGNIGYQCPGLIPIRARGNGALPVPGWTDDYEWQGFIPFEELPYSYNPPKGYIVTANNAVVSGRYPYLINSEFAHGYRARRITDVIESDRDGISVEDVQEMQGDTLNLSSLEILPYLKDLSFEETDIAGLRDRLLDWDGRMERESWQAALFGYFLVELVERTFQDQIPEKLWESRAVFGFSRLEDSLFHLLREPDNGWWDDRTTVEKESRDDILRRALVEAVERGKEQLGKKVTSWRWGKVHTATFRNQTFGMSGIALIEAIFNRGPVETAGGATTVSSAEFAVHDPFGVVHLTSQRQIIDLGNLSNSLMIHTTGQSGHPADRHYDDYIDSWRKIRYHPTRWDRPSVEAGTRRRLVLGPR